MVIGDPNAKVLCVMPYDPGAGTMVWFYERMREVGILKTDIRIIYILEEPPLNSGGRPSIAQIREATDRVEKEIAESNPSVVMPFGSDALYLTTGLKEKTEDARGYLIPPTLRGALVRENWEVVGAYKTSNKTRGYVSGDPKYGWVKRTVPGMLPQSFSGWIIPSYTLTNIRLSGFSLQPAFKADIRRAKRALDDTLEIIDTNFTYHTSIVHGFVFEGEALAIDIETVGIDNDTIERIALSDGKTSFTLLWNEDTRAWVDYIINGYDGWLLFHNRPFDIPRLRANGVSIPEGRIFDTMYGAVVVQPDLPKGLGRVTPTYLDTYPWKWDRLQEANPEFYSAKDGYATARLFLDGLAPITKQLRMWPLVTGEGFDWGPGIMKTIPVLSDMSEIGLRINRTFAEKWGKELGDGLLVLHQKWAEMFPDVDPNSSKQVIKLLYDTWKLPVIKTKEDGVTSNELAIVKTKAYIQTEYAQTKDNSPWRQDARAVPDTFSLLLNIRESSKNLDTYCTPVMMSEDTYVHPSYLPAGNRRKDEDNDISKGNTSTGRLAASHPNIQNQTKYARNLYVPDNDGLCFLQHDYQRAELFSMAWSAGDDVMLDDLRTDPYQKVADQVGVPRKTAKNVVLAGQYLAGPNKVSEMILKQEHYYVSPLECDRILKGISSRWRLRTAYVRWLVDQCKTKGYLINPFGRVRVFHDRRGPAAVDFIPQSIVADVLWCVLLDVWNAAQSLGGRLTTTVHDSVLTQIPEANCAEAAVTIKNIMEKRFDCVAKGFFLPVEFQIGAPGAAWGTL